MPATLAVAPARPPATTVRIGTKSWIGSAAATPGASTKATTATIEARRMASAAHHRREAFEAAQRKLAQRVGQPGAEDPQHAEDHDHFGDEGERLLLDLCDRLKERDREADHQ